MADTINSTPDFMCSATIERSERTGTGPSTALPPLHLDAGIVNGIEIYRSPSTPTDEDILKNILALYRKAGTGSFAMYARSLFLTTEATYYGGPEESLNGRTLARMDFTMPREVSHYSINTGGKSFPLAYSGSIWTNPRNLEVARVLLKANDLPQDSGIKAITQTIDYERGSILGFSVLLPAATALTVIETNTREFGVAGHFANCHEFVSKRGDRFVENGLKIPVAPTAAAQALPSIDELLPEKTRLDMMLDDPIDERTTTEKSTLSFTVLHDVKKDGKVVIPKGAKAIGHVTRILRQTYPYLTAVKGYYLVGILLDTIDIDSRQFRIAANLERVGPPAVQIGFLPLSNDPDRWGDFEDRKGLFMVPPAEAGESFLGIVSEFLRLGSHWSTFWTLAKPRT